MTVCLIAFAWQAHPRYPLIVAGNRDEFFARPTASARWSADGQWLSGIDLRGGGTWMGVARAGRFAALTNHRDPRSARIDAPSRGLLCVDVLAGELPVERTLDRVADDAARYNGFNLLAGRWGVDGEAALWMVDSASQNVTPVAPGIHGLSNARLDTPWPKVARAKERLAGAIGRGLNGDALIEDLLVTLSDAHVAADDDLPSTGIPLAFERALSAAFIRLPDYGTRSSTVLLVDERGHVTFVERRRDLDVPAEESRFRFQTASAALAS